MVGGGGREHALAAVLGRTADVVVTPGNPGIDGSVANPPEEVDADLFVVGPEAPLVDGLAYVDAMAVYDHDRRQLFFVKDRSDPKLPPVSEAVGRVKRDLEIDKGDTHYQVVVPLRWGGVGLGSRAGFAAREETWVFTLRDGRIRHVREYATKKEALEATGLRD